MQNSFIQWFATRFMDRTLLPHELIQARKIVYVVLIVALFGGSYFWRTYSVEAQAAELGLQEESRGDVELSGSVIRLSLTGLRGVATCYLWDRAMEKQKKHQWNELEFYVRAMTKLQPHFITPWLFQGWNLSYNVSVEADRISDKYFYIARGVQLLAEGERRNRHNPNMRWSIGFTQQHKIAQSDESNVLRSLYQLSCIPSNKRDPARFYKTGPDGTRELNWIEFEKFCKENPKLVRRLHSGLRRPTDREDKRQFTCRDPEEVVQFLADNWRVPGLFEEGELTPEGAQWTEKPTKMLAFEDRFPVLPPERNPPEPQKPFEPATDFPELTRQSVLTDDIDAYLVARAWYGYAQEPLPHPSKRWPGLNEPITSRQYQRNSQMTTLIFRSQPALAQTHHAESLQQEGWFDDSPWEIPSWFQDRQDNFSDGSPAQLTITKAQSSQQAWSDAFRFWTKHGNVTHLLLTPTEQLNKFQNASKYWKKFGLLTFSPPLVEPDEEHTLPSEDQEPARAARFLYEYNTYRNVSNFPHHYHKAEVEKEEATVTARRLFFEAEYLRRHASRNEALRKYEQQGAFGKPPGTSLNNPKETVEWPGFFGAYRDKVLSWPDLNTHRKYREDSDIQDYAFTAQFDYLRLKRELEEDPAKKNLTVALVGLSAAMQGAINQSGIGLNFVPPASPYVVQPLVLLDRFRMVPEPLGVCVLNQHTLPDMVVSFLGVPASPIVMNPATFLGCVAVGSRPFIEEHVSTRVLVQKGVIKAPEPDQGPGGGTPPPPPPPPNR